mmetsp:Transcript_17790/g.32956  ORF Transcript_17790/g.32956 Transcript_17790/m.32956 type:complete len:469 (-) Transcript_17790:155-1561(-)
MMALSNSTSPWSTTSTMNIQVPGNMFRENGYNHLKSQFGFPPNNVGGTISQYVYYTRANMCQWGSQGGFDPREKGPFILLIDRSDCAIPKQVRYAQFLGASAVVIADSECFCADNECRGYPYSYPDSRSYRCWTSPPNLADDGSALDVTIPSFLMNKLDAFKLKQTLQGEGRRHLNSQPVQMDLTWSLGNANGNDGRVQYDLWTSPTDLFGNQFIETFRPIANAFGSQATNFHPHMVLINGTRINCNAKDMGCYICDSVGCKSQCSNGGRYCASKPSDSKQTGISGVDIVRESLRRMCIWKIHGRTCIWKIHDRMCIWKMHGKEDSDNGNVWWDYVHVFLSRCFTWELFSDEDCIKKSMDRVGVDASRVNQCMKDSGDLKMDSPNTMLEFELAAQRDNGVVQFPTLQINGNVLRTKLTPSNVFHAICDAYDIGSKYKPGICQQCSSCFGDKAVLKCVEDGVCTGPAFN